MFENTKVFEIQIQTRTSTNNVWIFWNNTFVRLCARTKSYALLCRVSGPDRHRYAIRS